MGLGLAPEGAALILGVTMLGLVGLGVGVLLGRWYLWVLGALILAVVPAAAFLFREPPRAVVFDPGSVLAPVDGRVVSVDSVAEPGYIGGGVLRVRFRTGLADVRVLRYPVDGVIDLVERDTAVMRLGINTGDARVLLLYDPDSRTVVAEGGLVDRAQRAALLPLWSTVELLVPASWDLHLAEGDRVEAGTTPMASLPAGAR